MTERLEQLAFFVPGLPVPQGGTSPRAGEGLANERLSQWRADCAVLAAAARRGRWPTAEPPECVEVRATFYLPRPASGPWSGARHPGGAPDADKLARALGDALETAQVVANDGQISTWSLRKRFAPPSPTARISGPGVDVVVRRADNWTAEGGMPAEVFGTLAALISESSDRPVRGILITTVDPEGACGFMGAVRDKGRWQHYSGEEVLGNLAKVVDSSRRRA